jgi:deazaflavin-dependent oxidoreductase (nitroreductase family)
MLFGPEHVERYRQTNGAEGHEWQGAHVLLLTTTGRRPGERRASPLIYGTRGNQYVVVVSKGGAPQDPGWYRNLSADPEVEVQVLADRFPARARTATGDERTALWDLMTEQWPAYDDYQDKTEREIPVVVLERD